MPVEAWFPVPIYVARIEGAEALNSQMLPLLRRHSQGRPTHQPHVTGDSYSGSNAPTGAQYLQRQPDLAPLYRAIHPHAAQFARQLELDLKKEHLYLGRSWVNILGQGGRIEPHNHMATLFSGVYYLQTPDPTGVLRFWDPKKLIRRDPIYQQTKNPFNVGHVDYRAEAGTLLMFPGWLMHGMPHPNDSSNERVSVAVDYFSVSLSGQSPPPPPTGLVEKLWRQLDEAS